MKLEKNNESSRESEERVETTNLEFNQIASSTVSGVALGRLLAMQVERRMSEN